MQQQCNQYSNHELEVMDHFVSVGVMVPTELSRSDALPTELSRPCSTQYEQSTKSGITNSNTGNSDSSNSSDSPA